jgi:ATP-binding cassette subfamily B protein
MLALSLMSTPVALLTPLPLKIAVDSVLGNESLPGFMQPLVPEFITDSKGMILILVVALVVIVALLAQLQGICSLILQTYTGEKLVMDFRAQLFRHAQRLSLSYHDSRGTSDSIYRIQYDALAVQWITTNGVIPFVTSIVTLVSMIYVTALIDLQLALVALAVSPLLYLILRTYGQRLRTGWRGQKKLESSTLKIVQETLGGIRVVKAFGQEDRERERFSGKASETLRARIRLSFQEGGLGSMVGLIIAAGEATVLFIGVRNVQAGTLTLGDLLLVMGYLSQLYRPLQSISKKVGDLQRSLASAERTFALLDQTPEVIEKPNAIPLSRAKGTVSFQNVFFAYEGENSPVLHNVSFEALPGTRVGIAGATGAGKTTLVSLLTRFYDPTSGRIMLDGVDLRDYRIGDLRNQFAIVLQEPVLFSTSIAENIAYANPDATYEEIVAAAHAANAHAFITSLPEGYDTQVGERGMRLSGGERQRISLARAFLKDAPILVLDEPTSSVDVKTEAVIMEAMARLMHERTTFMIAHRLSTLANCDVRLQIEGGRVIDFEQRRIMGAGAAGNAPDSLHRAKEVDMRNSLWPQQQRVDQGNNDIEDTGHEVDQRAKQSTGQSASQAQGTVGQDADQTRATEAWATFHRGTIFDRQGNYDLAVEAYQRVIASGHSEAAPRAAFNLGILFEERGEYARAGKAYQQAIDSEHSEWAPKVVFDLGILFEEHGAYDLAEQAYRRAIDSGHPEAAPRAAFDLGILLEERGEYDLAEEAYRRAIDSSHPEEAPRAAFNLGLMLDKQGEYGLAGEAYQQAIDSKHSEWAPKAAFNLGVLLEERGEYDRAVEAYQRAIATEHPDAAVKANLSLGVLFEQRGAYDLAEAEEAP